LSRDVDLFHDTAEALERSWQDDIALFRSQGWEVVVLRDVATFKEVLVRRSGEELLVRWARDSAFRFFPLVEHEELGLTLHPFDLASGKVLALVGRLEPRDWLDVLACDDRIQPLGYLAWAACAKDPGFNPVSLLAEARRSSRYSQEELNELAFAGPPPDAAACGRKWHTILTEADAVVAALARGGTPGTCVLEADGTLCRRRADDLAQACVGGKLRFHSGSIRGALPRVG